MNQGAFAFYGLRRLAPAADVFFGGRVNTIQANLRFNGPGQRSADGSKTWFDPLVGLQLHTPETGKRWHAQVYTEIGGFGVGSTFTWQIFPTVGVNLAKWASLEFGYRWLDIDYSSGENATLFKWDVLTQGPVVGVRRSSSERTQGDRAMLRKALAITLFALAVTSPAWAQPAKGDVSVLFGYTLSDGVSGGPYTVPGGGTYDRRWTPGSMMFGLLGAAVAPPPDEFWPEIDTWLRLSPAWRVSLFVPISKNLETHYREGNLIPQVDFAFGKAQFAAAPDGRGPRAEHEGLPAARRLSRRQEPRRPGRGVHASTRPSGNST